MVSLQQPNPFGKVVLESCALCRRLSAPTAPWGVRGTRTAPYCATPESDGVDNLNCATKITSISAMPHYKDRTHEELRLEDYELGNGVPVTTVQKGSSFPFQNQGNAFQRSNSPFGLVPAPVPSSHPLSGSLARPTFGTATTALVSDSSVKPQFRCVSTGYCVPSNFNMAPATPPSFSTLGSTSSPFGISNVPPSAPSTDSSGFGTSTFRFSGASVPEAGLNFPSAYGSTSSTFGVSTTPALCSSSSPFGVYNMPPSAPSTASIAFGTSTFTFPCASVLERRSSPACKFTTPEFGVFNMPPSAPSTASSGFGKCTFKFPSASVPEEGLSSPSALGSTSSTFVVSTTPAFCSTSSTYGVYNMPSSTASSSFGTSTFTFPSASVPEGGLSFPSTLGSTSSTLGVSTTPAFCSTRSAFGIYNMPPFTANNCFRTSTFRFPSATVPDGGLSFPACNFSTTPAFCSASSPFGVSNMPSSAPSTASSDFGTSTFRFPSWPTTPSSCSTLPSANSVLSVPISSSNTVAPGFWFSSSPANGIQTSGSLYTTAANCQGSGVASYSSPNKVSGEMFLQCISAMPTYKEKSHEELRSEDVGCPGTIAAKYQGSGVASYSATKEDDSSNNKVSRDMFLQSISAMPTYKEKSHEELRLEDTGSLGTTAAKYQGSRVASYSATREADSSNDNRKNSINSSNAIFTAPTPSPPVNPFCRTNVFPSQSQSFTLQSDRASVMPNPNPPFGVPFTEPSKQSTSVTASDPCPSIVKASQPQHVEPLLNYYLSNRSQGNDPTTVQFPGLIINGQQYVPSSTLSVESSPVLNLFTTQLPVDQPYTVTPRQHGICSMPVCHRSCETKVPFFNNEEDRPVPVAPFLPRENPRAWANISLSLGSLQLEENSTSFTVDKDSLQQHQDIVAPRSERHVDDVLALLPKLPDGDYYTEPSLQKLAAKEMAEAGFCSHVKDFMVGRKGYGSIKFLGETDVRHLDIKSVVQFNNPRELIVFPDGRMKPEVGQHLNKAAEVSILNVKCIDKKTGKQYVAGHQIECYQKILINKTVEQGAEFVSYDPVEGEWKFRVQHF